MMKFCHENNREMQTEAFSIGDRLLDLVVCQQKVNIMPRKSYVQKMVVLKNVAKQDRWDAPVTFPYDKCPPQA